MNLILDQPKLQAGNIFPPVASKANVTIESEQFEIGIAEIDTQKHLLLELLARFKTSSGKHYGYAMNVILDELAIRAWIQFSVEESLMKLLGFPEREEHVLQHRGLTSYLQEMRKKGQDFDISYEVSDFVENWLSEHVLNFDRKFVSHFIHMGVDHS